MSAPTPTGSTWQVTLGDTRQRLKDVLDASVDLLLTATEARYA